MTGGGIAQLCNAIPFDDHRHDAVIINAGTNELNEENLSEFLFTINKTKTKLESLGSEIKTTVVLPALSTETPEQIVKSQYLHEAMSSVTTIEVIQLTQVEMADYRHPTRDGTLQILKQIQETIPILLEDAEEDDATTKLKYRRVQSLYKV